MTVSHGTAAHIARVIKTRGSFVRKITRDEKAQFSKDHRTIMAADLINHVAPAVFRNMTDTEIINQYSWLLKLKLIKKLPKIDRRKDPALQAKINKVLNEKNGRD